METAVELLPQRGYDILYIGRPNTVELADGTRKTLTAGPDLVAVRNGRTVVVEAKGSVATAEHSGLLMLMDARLSRSSWSASVAGWTKGARDGSSKKASAAACGPSAARSKRNRTCAGLWTGPIPRSTGSGSPSEPSTAFSAGSSP
ncbi:MAG TPA: hypothetical protein VM324_00115 [Egibacteraceae bacterium]|nr:hypothetical protein [Egibacteraceae bacterium]